ncbi:MAG TPA: DUF1573 domain-containing protein [Draconibacterium sp.]|nr:DUF1573 domain-containing protein [Draconibacterium sp.]
MRLVLKITFVCALVFSILKCTSPVENKNAQIEFKITEYDFGKLELNADGNCSFEFSNSGETPLVIQNVETSCACTVPEWPKKPIKLEKSGEIIIHYDTSHPGMFSKTITVFYNGENSPLALTIKGIVSVP